MTVLGPLWDRRHPKVLTLAFAGVLTPFAAGATPSLCAIGDSLAVPDQWVSKLPAEWEVTAHGIPGASAMWLWQNERSTLDECDPDDTCTLNLGSNDRYIGFPATGFKAWAALVVDYLVEVRGANSVMLWYVNPYEQVAEELCAEYGITCLSQKALLEPEHYLDPISPGSPFAEWEGVHPNAAGQQLMADYVEFLVAVPEPPALGLLAAGLALLAVIGTTGRRT